MAYKIFCLVCLENCIILDMSMKSWKIALVFIPAIFIFSSCHPRHRVNCYRFIGTPMYNKCIDNVLGVHSLTTVASEASEICSQDYGIKKGTRLYYRCMNTQVEQQEYHQEKNECVIRANIDCRHLIPKFTFRYKQRLAACVLSFINKCQENAAKLYIPKKKSYYYHFYNHQYTHYYNHTFIK